MNIKKHSDRIYKISDEERGICKGRFIYLSILQYVTAVLIAAGCASYLRLILHFTTKKCVAAFIVYIAIFIAQRLFLFRRFRSHRD